MFDPLKVSHLHDFLFVVSFSKRQRCSTCFGTVCPIGRQTVCWSPWTGHLSEGRFLPVEGQTLRCENCACWCGHTEKVHLLGTCSNRSRDVGLALELSKSQQQTFIVIYGDIWWFSAFKKFHQCDQTFRRTCLDGAAVTQGAIEPRVDVEFQRTRQCWDCVVVWRVP